MAILLVLAIHIPHDAPGGWRENPWFFAAFLADFGYLGVPLFIVISGFCIHRTAAVSYAAVGRYRFDWIQFWKRRFIRLYPPYLAAIALSLASAFWLHARFSEPARFLGWDLGTHLLLVHNLTSEFAGSLGNGAFWSLGTEEQLYALYFALLALLYRYSRRNALITVAATTVAWRLITPFWPNAGVDLGAFHLGQWFQWPMQYWLHWALGAIAVDAYVGNRALPPWCRSPRLAWVAIGIGLLINRNTFDLMLRTHLGLPALRAASEPTLAALSYMGELAVLAGIFLLLNWALQAERSGGFAGRGTKVVAWIGQISYSLYLVHIPIIYMLDDRLTFGSTPMQWIIRYLTYGAVALVAGYAFHQAVERWFLHGRLPGLGLRTSPVPERAT